MSKLQKIFIASSFAVVVALAGYFYYQLSTVRQNSELISEQEVSDLVTKVSALIVLPVGETPTIATVSDPEALKDQPFFAQAQKGDKVLIYAQAKKAILYSVSLNKILDVAPLNIGDKTVKNSNISNTVTPTPKTSTVTPTQTLKKN
jgi:hypothetical protein